MRYFTEDEFRRCRPSCSSSQMDPVFISLLEEAREIADCAFYPLSCYRSPDWDRKRGRSGRGFHTLGRAMDISCGDGASRARIVRACLNVGLSVGVYKSFLHIDNRPNQIVFYGN